MIDALRTLSNTPVPTILVLAGVAFLLLAIAGRITTAISIQRENKALSLGVGVVLILAGLALYSAENLPGGDKPATPPATTGTETETTATGLPIAAIDKGRDPKQFIWVLQFGAFQSESSANSYLQSLNARGIEGLEIVTSDSIRLPSETSDQTYHHIIFGPRPLADIEAKYQDALAKGITRDKIFVRTTK